MLLGVIAAEVSFNRLALGKSRRSPSLDGAE
jgi:hypothetical protein